MSIFSFVPSFASQRKGRTEDTPTKAPYTYTPLQDNQIRLLKLYPGATDSIIACSLRTVNLSDYDEINGWAREHEIKSFDAISYVWGSAQSTFEIDCDGKSAHIGTGLQNVLNGIRDPHKVRIIWADALCINQQDDDERANQIQLMGLIYWKAQRVHVWLGPGKHEHGYRTLKTASAVEMIRLLGSNLSHESSITTKSTRRSSKLFNFKSKKSSKAFHRQQWSDLADMFERPWFKRVWVVQELGLSKDATFYYGKSSFSRDELEELLAYLYTRGYENIHRYHLNLRSLRIVDNYQDTTRGNHRLEFGSDPSLAESFLDVLERARGLQCTDPRDGIYAFLGHPAAFKQFLLDDNPFMWYPRNYNSGKQTFLTPDYSRYNTLAQLYLDVAISAMKKLTHGLTVLCHVAHIKETLNESFSSWIPRWDLSGEPSLFYGPYSFYRASGELQHTTLDTILANESYGDHKLLLKALHLGKVQFKHPNPTSASFAAVAYKFLTDPSAIVNHCTSVTCQEKSICLPPFSHQMDPVSLAITLTAGYTKTELLNRPAEEDSQSHLNAFCSYLRREVASKQRLPEVSAEDHEGADRYALQLQRVALQRAFFCTTSGYPGLGPYLLSEGDEIWLPMGAKMPFIFRPVGEGLFKVLGQTYLHGVMRGEAVAGLTEKDFHVVTLC